MLDFALDSLMGHVLAKVVGDARDVRRVVRDARPVERDVRVVRDVRDVREACV